MLHHSSEMVEEVQQLVANMNTEKLPLPQPNKERKRQYNPGDGISRLPEEILARIVSRLPLKDAAATSILSQQWYRVWTYTKTLNFYYKRSSNWDSENITSRFMEWVDSVIKQHKGDIDLFRVVFNLTRTSKSSSSCINNWIRFAMKKRVQFLYLCLCTSGRFRKIKPHYVLCQKLFSPKCYVGFKSLKVLHLRNVNVCGEVIEYLLSKCFILEELRVRGSSTLINLRVVGPSLALTCLEIAYCVKIKSIEICDTENLVSFLCFCYEEDHDLRLLIRNVPMLLKVYIYSSHIDYGHVLKNKLSFCLSRLKFLGLGLTKKPYEENGVYPISTNLKWLTLVLNLHDKSSLLRLVPFMKAFPYLHGLTLQLISYKENEELDLELLKPTKCPHNYLKKLAILNYLGRTCDIEVIFYLIENVVSLEQISVDTGGKEKGRSHAMQHLKGKIPSTIEFVYI